MDRVPSDTRPMLLLQHRLEEDVTATQSPTEFSTQQKSSGSSSKSRNSSNTVRTAEPLLTPGEKIGALIGGTISLMIAMYFVLLSVRVKRYRKRQHRRHQKDDERSSRRKDSSSFGWKKHAEEGGKRRRPREIAEREDDREEKSDRLTIVGGGDLLHSDCDSTMAIITTGVSPTKPQNRYEDDDCNETNASTIEMASAYSLSSDDGSPRRFSPSRNRVHKKKKKNKSTTSSDYNSTEWSTRSQSLTSVVLNAILPNRSKDSEEPSCDDYDSSYYIQHTEKEDDETSTSTTISSPFHPSPPPRITPPRLKRTKKQKTYFMSNDDSVLSETVGGTTVTSSSAMTEDVFTGIPEEDRPFDCETEAGNFSDDRPFDCVA